MKIKSYSPATRTQLAKRYGVSLETFKKWLDRFPELATIKGRVLTPREVERVIYHLGEPPDSAD